jgi:hypothetical protein
MPIFVAGTGRSGTTRLSQVLGEHPEVSTLQHESRFLVDPGGLEDLVRAFTSAYTPYHADDALSRLEALLTRRLTGLEDSVFAGWNVPGEVGAERYYAWAQRFLAELTWYAFDEYGPGAHRRIGRYFPDRAELVALCARNVDELFSGVARDRGKRIWCEKTPFNLLSTGFLWEMFPDARVVHVMRHPLAVAASHLDQPWAPHDLESVCSWLEPVYRRWLDVRDDHLADTRYVEVRLEDLTADWPGRRPALFERLGLPDAQTPSGMDGGRAAHVGRRLSIADEHLVRERLGFAVVALGYAP